MFVVIMVLVPLGCAELLAYVLTRSHGFLFAPDDREIDAVIDEDSYRSFLATLYHPELGWQNPRGRSLTEANCLGEEKVYSWDENGARHLEPGEDVQAIVVGDSYTHGHEASDAETYPHRLGVHSGLKIANYGVNGFGPLQAALQFERAIERHPTARIAILGVMSENIRRLPNSYRGVLRLDNNPYHFKPFVDVSNGEPRQRPNPNAPAAASMEELRMRIEAALRVDYWRLPKPSFPYLWSAIQAVQTREFQFLVRWKLNGGGAKAEYGDRALVAGLRRTLHDFIDHAEAEGVLPVIAFIPQNRLDKDGSAATAALISELRAEAPGSLIRDVGDAEMDWSRYNLRGTGCHPSP
jgi:hypothetical protein